MTGLADRIVLVTGATGALGRFVVSELGAAGARLGLVGTDEDRLLTVAREARIEPERFITVTADLRHRKEADKAVAQVADRFGGLDVVAHLVGGWRGGTPISEIADADVAAMLDQHAWTTLNVIRAAAPRLVERGWGRIVAVSSPVATAPTAGMGAYAVGKAAEEALLMTLARELVGTGVSVNIVHVRTIDANRERELQPSTKNAHWTTPEEIWAAISYLCSDEAIAISGARIRLDHGA